MLVDAAGVTIVATSILGLLAQIASSGIAVTISRPTEHLAGLLSTTHLDRLFTIRSEQC